MGWTFPFHTHTKESIVEDILERGNSSREDNPYKWSVVKHALRGNHLWTVERREKKDDPNDVHQFIVLYLLQFHREDKVYGYKDIEASMGPYDCDCPVKFLDLVSDNCKTSDYPNFERRVRERIESKKKEVLSKSTLEMGDKLIFKSPLNYGGSPVDGINISYKIKRTFAGDSCDKEGKVTSSCRLLRIPKINNWARIIKKDGTVIEIEEEKESEGAKKDREDQAIVFKKEVTAEEFFKNVSIPS